MPISKIPMIADLSEKEHKPVQKWIGVLPEMFRQCECYLRDYGAGEQNVYKLLQEMDWTCDLIADARCDLIERHKLWNVGPFKSRPK